jgi:hypothetical protein
MMAHPHDEERSFAAPLPNPRRSRLQTSDDARKRNDSVPAPVPGFRYRSTSIVDGAACNAAAAQALPDDLGDHDFADGAAETFVQSETEMK